MEGWTGSSDRLQMWGGIECSRSRIGDDYFDQLTWNGHYQRPDDLERIAALGIRTLRYPVLWERAAPDDPQVIDWTWANERLGLLHSLGIHPIVGLMHHSSGPKYTDLLAPNLAAGLADFACQLARRFPWVDAYTPVNEPLTTARFSALYGHWYPHQRDGLAFAHALLNQCRAVVLAMQKIRTVQPGAKLVQTEDLGKTFSTPALAYQAAFENERRWLTFDLLCGRVDRQHPMGAYFCWLGVDEKELLWFQDNPCPPDIVGVNHYVTSERFLDEQLERYPPSTWGGNGRQTYADIEAVRTRAEGLAGPGLLLREAWERYHLPLAITEVHLGCTRDEQLRWLWEVWHAATAARREGIDVQAITSWSMLGTFDWDSLMTCAQGHYETGAFDVRSPERRPTALADLIRKLATGQDVEHPVLAQPGWWHRPERLLGIRPEIQPKSSSRPLLITGATGTLGRAFARVCTERGLPFRLLGRAELDITCPQQIHTVLTRINPWAIVNAAGYVRVDEAERDPGTCFRENVLGASALADACAQGGMPLVTFSTDLVFDGRQCRPYREGDSVGPLGVYGRAKVAAERRVLSLHSSALVVRTSAFFGPWDDHNFVTVGLRTLGAGGSFPAAEDAVVSPTYVPDLIHACLDLLLDGEHGIWHLANQGETTWAAFARRAAELADLDPTRVQSKTAKALGLRAPRPRYSPLSSERGALLPTLEDALQRYFRDLPRTIPSSGNKAQVTQLGSLSREADCSHLCDNAMSEDVPLPFSTRNADALPFRSGSGT